MEILQHHWLRSLPVIAAVCLALSAAAHAQTPYYVDAARPDDSGNGLTWGTAKQTIQAAIDLTIDGDTVWIADGIYLITAQITIDKGITVRSVNGPETVIVQRDIGTTRIVSIAHADAVLAGLTLRNGNQAPGAGINMTAGLVTNCHVIANAAGANGSGGGVWMSGGRLTGCLVASNTVAYNGGGCGIYISGGLVDYSVIRHNTGSSAGGSYIRGAGIQGAGGLVRNCLIVDNDNTIGTADRTGGGVYGGTYENCTIARNKARSSGGAHGATLINCIVYQNEATTEIGHNYSGGTWSWSCTTPLPAGPGNTDGNPFFVDSAARDFRLRPGSPAIDTGTNLTWMADAVDLDGQPRINNGQPDMGCYEYVTGPLLCSFTGMPLAGNDSLPVDFQAAADGTNLAGLTYYWEFYADGTTAEPTSAAVTNHLYSAGLHSVKLTVSNDVGEVSSLIRENYVRVSPPVIYVATTGTHTSPYTNWATAATNIRTAVDLAGDGTTIRIADGTYSIDAELPIDRGMLLQSVNGPDHTVIARQSGTQGRVVDLTHSNAVLTGLTLRGGNTQAGGGIHMTAGTVSNCHILGNSTGGSGGGIHMTGGLLTGCLVASNLVTYNRGGGGIYMSGGLVEYSVIRHNTGSSGGGSYIRGMGIQAIGGLVRNSLIIDNDNTVGTSGRVGGGVYGGTYENCTIARNKARSSGGAHNATLINCIVYQNEATTEIGHNYSGGTWSWSCTTPLPAGPGNTDGNPFFVDSDARNFRLRPGSPAIDTGTNLTWMADAVDLDGQPRIAGAAPDMGCYEYVAGPLLGSFVGTPLTGHGSLWVDFTATVDGTNLNEVTFHWDFNGDGLTDQHDTIATAGHLYGAGLFSVMLTVSNAAGERSELIRPDYVTVSPDTLYVSTTGTHLSPYTGWATAATNIRTAVDLAGDDTTIWIADGTYWIDAELPIDRSIRLRSVNGPDLTIIARQPSTQGRVVNLTHSNAVLTGLTFRGGNTHAGGGIYMTAGTVSNCHVRNNSTGGSGGGVHMTGGLLTGCLVADNTGMYNTGGAGIYISGGLVENSVIRGNTGVGGGSLLYGAGVRSVGGLVRNCLIIDNDNTIGTPNRVGGGVYGGTYENCTIARNRASSSGGAHGATLINCIVVDNEATDDDSDNYSGGVWSYSCSTPLPAGAGNMDADPLFRDAANDDFRLSFWPALSPCIDAGTNRPWMTDATDLDGYPRIMGSLQHLNVPRTVDMGAYENRPRKGATISIR